MDVTSCQVWVESTGCTSPKELREQLRERLQGVLQAPLGAPHNWTLGALQMRAVMKADGRLKKGLTSFRIEKKKTCCNLKIHVCHLLNFVFFFQHLLLASFDPGPAWPNAPHGSGAVDPRRPGALPTRGGGQWLGHPSGVRRLSTGHQGVRIICFQNCLPLFHTKIIRNPKTNNSENVVVCSNICLTSIMPCSFSHKSSPFFCLEWSIHSVGPGFSAQAPKDADLPMYF